MLYFTINHLQKYIRKDVCLKREKIFLLYTDAHWIASYKSNSRSIYFMNISDHPLHGNDSSFFLLLHHSGTVLWFSTNYISIFICNVFKNRKTDKRMKWVAKRRQGCPLCPVNVTWLDMLIRAWGISEIYNVNVCMYIMKFFIIVWGG